MQRLPEQQMEWSVKQMKIQEISFWDWSTLIEREEKMLIQMKSSLEFYSHLYAEKRLKKIDLGNLFKKKLK